MLPPGNFAYSTDDIVEEIMSKIPVPREKLNNSELIELGMQKLAVLKELKSLHLSLVLVSSENATKILDGRIELLRREVRSLIGELVEY